MDWNKKEDVLKAIKSNGENLQFITNDKLKNDREIIYKAIKNTGKALKYVPNKFKDDDEIVEEAVKRCGSSIKFASFRLLNNKEIVLKAVSNEGEALQYLPKELRDNKLIVYQAVLNDPASFKFASDKLRDDKEFIKILFLKYKIQLENYCKEANLSEKEIRNIFKDVEIFKNLVRSKLRSNKKFIMEILEIYPYSYSELKASYKKDKEIINIAVEQEGMNLLYLPKDLKADIEFLIKSINLNKHTFTGNILSYIPEKMKVEILNNVKKNLDYLNKTNKMAFSINYKSKLFSISNLKYIASIYNIDLVKLMFEEVNYPIDKLLIE